MPLPARPWFRLYSDLLDNPKIQRLKPVLRCHWLNLVALANVSEPRGQLPPLKDVAFRLRISEKQASGAIGELTTLRLIDAVGDAFVMHDWKGWQYDGDVANALADPGDAGSLGNHTRWHVNRGIVAPDCPFCIAGESQGNRGDASGRIAKGIASPHRIASREEIRGDTETEEIRADIATSPDFPFAFAYAAEYQRRHAGRPPSPIEHAAALALERQFGAEACIEVAKDLDWQKHPNYLKPILEERQHGPTQTGKLSRSRAGGRTRDASESWANEGPS